MLRNWIKFPIITTNFYGIIYLWLSLSIWILTIKFKNNVCNGKLLKEIRLYEKRKHIACNLVIIHTTFFASTVILTVSPLTILKQ